MEVDSSWLRTEGGRFEFFRDADGLWFGSRPPGAAPVDLFSGRRDDVDDTQALFATAYLQRVSRDEDAARLFAAQTECTLDQARDFCASAAEPDPARTFSPPPWRLPANDEITTAHRSSMWGLAAAAGIVLLGVVALVVFLWL